MIKMIVIDDEFLVRVGIKETISWHEYGVEIVGEAPNGKSGLELVKALQPDIIITDIKMPVMDGLELVKRIKELNYENEIIILSGYKDFEYAKDTLENGAFSYLLKPIDNKELIEKVLSAIKKLNEERNTKNFIENLRADIPAIKNKIVQDILIENIEKDAIKEKLTLYDIKIDDEGVVVYCKLDELNNEKDGKKREEALLSLYNNLHDRFKEKATSFYSDLTKENFYLICSMTSDESEKICNEVINEYAKTNLVVVSLGISTYKSLSMLSDAYKKAKELTENKLYPLINTVANELHPSINNNPLIIQAMEYIAQNYSRNITVKMVADSLYVSESHLMHLFKDSINKTFNECLTDYRIMIAKQLLASRKFKVYEIAELVGYNDSKYFSQIFKKRVGLSPNQYIENEVIK